MSAAEVAIMAEGNRTSQVDPDVEPLRRLSAIGMLLIKLPGKISTRNQIRAKILAQLFRFEIRYTRNAIRTNGINVNMLERRSFPK